MDVDFVQRIMRQKSYPSEKVAPPKISKKIKSRKFRNKNNSLAGRSKNVFDVDAEFQEPEYLNDLGYHLVSDIENLKKEVIPLRKQVFTYMKLDNNLRKLPAEAVCLDIIDIDQINNIDLSQRVNDLNLQLTDLSNEYNTMKVYYKNATKIQFEQDLSHFNEKITNLNLKINKIKNIIKASREKVKQINESPAKIKFEQNLDRIIELSKLKNQLQTDQEAQIDIHYAYSQSRMPDPALQNQLETLQRQYQSIKYLKSQKKVEMNKMLKNYDDQRKCMHQIIQKHEMIQKSSRRNQKMSRHFARQYSQNSDYQSLEKTDSDIYYVEDVEIQTNDIVQYRNDEIAPRRYHHHRRKTRKHSPTKKTDEINDQLIYNTEEMNYKQHNVNLQYNENRIEDESRTDDTIQDAIKFIHENHSIDNQIPKDDEIDNPINSIHDQLVNKKDKNDTTHRIEDTVETFNDVESHIASNLNTIEHAFKESIHVSTENNAINNDKEIVIQEIKKEEIEVKETIIDGSQNEETSIQEVHREDVNINEVEKNEIENDDDYNQAFEESKNKSQPISPKQVAMAHQNIMTNKPHFSLTFAKDSLGFGAASTINDNSSSYENTIVLENELNSDNTMRNTNDSFNQLTFDKQLSNDEADENDLDDNQIPPFGNGHLPFVPLKVIQLPVV